MVAETYLSKVRQQELARAVRHAQRAKLGDIKADAADLLLNLKISYNGAEYALEADEKLRQKLKHPPAGADAQSLEECRQKLLKPNVRQDMEKIVRILPPVRAILERIARSEISNTEMLIAFALERDGQDDLIALLNAPRRLQHLVRDPQGRNKLEDIEVDIGVGGIDPAYALEKFLIKYWVPIFEDLATVESAKPQKTALRELIRRIDFDRVKRPGSELSVIG